MEKVANAVKDYADTLRLLQLGPSGLDTPGLYTSAVLALVGDIIATLRGNFATDEPLNELLAGMEQMTRNAGLLFKGEYSQISMIRALSRLIAGIGGMLPDKIAQDAKAIADLMLETTVRLQPRPKGDD